MDLVERLEAARGGDAGAKGADQLFHAGVDVGAIEGRHAGVEGREQTLDRRLALDGAMTAGQLPAAADDARDLVIRPQGDALDLRHGASSCGSGTAVTS